MSQRASEFMEAPTIDGLVQFYLEHRNEIEVIADDDALFMISFLDHIRIATKKELVKDLGFSPEVTERILERLIEAGLLTRIGNQYFATEKASKLVTELGLRDSPEKDKIRVLIADEEEFAETLKEELARVGYRTDVATHGPGALEKLRRQEFDLLIMDIEMPKLRGMDVLKAVREMALPPEVIVLTRDASIPTAVEAMKHGAYNYITKPYKTAELNLLIKKAYEKQQILRENLYLKTRLGQEKPFPEIVTESPKIRQILQMLVRIAPTDSPVLITGESGTGKELIAKAIQQHSKRADKAFLVINCGAIPETLLESELFGHVKGAFTGAVVAKAGLFEVADGGTVFLDEIGETSLAIQVKLLRILQERVFRRVGGTDDIEVDVRVIAATHQDLQELIHKGRFREDLYYRLNVIPIHLPPLRERPEDIRILAEHFLRTASIKWGHKKKNISRDAMNLLRGYAWPGNIRELHLVVERAVALSKGDTLMAEDLPPDLFLFRVAEAPARQRKDTLREMERILILKALEHAAGSGREAAAILGISLAKFKEKLKAYKLGDEKAVR